MSKQNSPTSIDSADIVIIGNGITGLTAAIEARRLATEKKIVIMTDQSHPTINTPALKQYAIGKMEREQLLAYPAGTEHLQRIHVVNAYIEEIHALNNYICLSGGRNFGYEKLLLATGSTPTGLPQYLPGRDFDGVLTLHRLQDYLDLRRRLNEVDEAVVIGGGAHACETVMSLLYWGIQVHWLIRSEAFMPRMLDQTASDMVLEGIRRAGAKIYTKTEVLGIVGRVGVVAGVVTTQQRMIPCNLVLVCTGTAPATALARNCDVPMKYRNGILVDDQLRTSVRNIYAAGDVAALRDPLTGQYSPRAQWYAVASQGRTVAATMTGEKEPRGFGIPWHATRLGGLSMLSVGNTLSWPESVVPLTERRKGRYCRLSVIDNRLVGYLSLGITQPDSLAIKRIIDEGLSVRDITKELLQGEFDARKYFSGKRSYAVQRMVTTGQLPTPLPPPALPGIVAGQSHTMSRVSPSPVVARVSAQRPARSAEFYQQVAAPPDIQRPSRQINAYPASERANPRGDDERRRIAAQRTLVSTNPDPELARSLRKEQEEVFHPSDRQFITLPRTPAYKPADAPANAPPTRSIWHYTNKLPAIRRDDVQK